MSPSPNETFSFYQASLGGIRYGLQGLRSTIFRRHWREILFSDYIEASERSAHFTPRSSWIHGRSVCAESDNEFRVAGK